MKTIILAAGIGERLQSVLKGKPKPLFELNGKSLIEYSLEALSKSGIKESTIVIGYNRHLIKEKIGDRFNNIDISYAENNMPDKTGSMHSLFSALKEPEDCLVLDGDIIYDSCIIQELLNYDKRDAVILAGPSYSKDEVYVLLDQDGRVIYLGKKHPQTEEYFEFVGISKFSKQFIEKMFFLHKQNLKNNKLEVYYEDHAFATSKFISWYGLVKKDLLWAEIDTPEHIEKSKQVLEKIKNLSSIEMA